jgi:hypothetical protein
MNARTRSRGAAAASTVDPALQAQVDAQLMEQGAFAPLEYLMDSGRLLYSDYESWRRREIEFLDDVLMGDRDRTLAEVEQAVSYARGIGLVEQTQEFHSWLAEQTLLRASADAKVHRLLAARYAPAQSAPQMDLFFDNPVVALTNGVARALAARDVNGAQQQLDRLYAQAPNHADLASFDRLSKALSHLHEAVADPVAEIDFLLNITADAKRLLGSDARDLLSPLWQRVGVALAGRAFSPDQPDLHRSFALAQAQDWVAVSECVMSEPRWFDHPILCLRLAQSSFHRRRRNEALMAWFHVCWRAPKQAAEALDSRRQADSEIAGLWQRFLDIEDEEPAGESSPNAPGTLNATSRLTAADFPAWLLLHEASLTRHLGEDISTGSTPGEEHYRCVHRWVRARETGRAQDEIALRKVLQAGQPALFRYLKRMVGPDGR